jgi:hypothetical protein
MFFGFLNDGAPRRFVDVYLSAKSDDSRELGFLLFDDVLSVFVGHRQMVQPGDISHDLTQRIFPFEFSNKEFVSEVRGVILDVDIVH